MSLVGYEQDGGVARLWVNRPKALNALNSAVLAELDVLLDRIAADGQVRVLIVGGETHFAAGADIRAMVDCKPEQALAFVFTPVFNKLAALEIPTIAAISGFALGGGLELALACDLRVASEQAKLELPELNVGIMPGAGGTIRLPRLVGYSKAFEMICLGVQLSGVQAEQVGLVNQAVPEAQLLQVARQWAAILCRKPGVALKAVKRTMRTGLSLAVVEDGCRYESQEWSALFSTEDQKEGMRAFLERRKPEFKGR